MKKRYSTKRRYAPKRRYKKKRTAGAKIGKSMQNKSYSYIKKKYTSVIPINANEGVDFAETTISHFGGRNTADPINTLTLRFVNPDGMAEEDMAAYQYFRITGVAFKLFFPEGTIPEATPVQWSMGYSNNLIIRPNIPTARLQTLASYNTSSCSASKPISRYFRTGKAQQRLGIEWCATSEYDSFGATPPVPLYGTQLQPDAGASTNVKVFRPASSVETENQIGRIQLTYYVQYKGPKGQNSLTN